MQSVTIRCSGDWKEFSGALRRASPALSERLHRELRVATREIRDEIRAQMPHKNEAPQATKGVRSVASGKGVGVIVGGSSPPKSYAYAFAHGNRGRGRLKHPVFGHWSQSPNTVMQTEPVADTAFEAGEAKAMAAADLALQSVVDELSFGGV